MYYLKGYEECIKTIGKLAIPFAEGQISDGKDLKKAYVNFLESQQPGVPRNKNGDGLPRIIMDEETEDGMHALFSGKTDLDDKNQGEAIEDSFTEQEKIMFKDKVNKATEFIFKVDPKLCELFNLSINDIFFKRSGIASGGSVSTAVGTIWLNPRENWEPFDLAELLVHEMTHCNIFIDEIASQHYIDYSVLHKEDFWVQSAILDTRRPLDKALHSIVVATEVLSFRSCFASNDQVFRIHPPTALMKENTLKALADLQKSDDEKHMLYAPIRSTLDKCKQHIEQL